MNSARIWWTRERVWLKEMMAEMQAEGKSLPPEWESLLAGVDLSDENCGVEILKREVQKKMAVSLWWD